MSILDFLGKWKAAEDNGHNMPSPKQQMIEELLHNIQQDFQEAPKEGSTVANFTTVLEQAIAKHIESQQPMESDEEWQPEVLPVDALSLFYVSSDHMEAYVCILPPLNGGSDIEREHFSEDMRYEGIIFGIDEAAISSLISGHNYLRIVKIAEGEPAQNGADGELEEMFERRREQILELKEGEPLLGLDFRRQNLVQPIHKGEIICHIKPPIKAKDGWDVSGHVLHGIGGKAVRVPQGENTNLSKDGSLLLASQDGVVVMKGDNFTVQNQNVVTQDITAEIGNLNYEGDVFIRGNIEDGVMVHATGNIIIDGEIHNAKIVSGGTIRVQNGVKGVPGTELWAARQIQCTVMENAFAVAKGDIYAEVIADSTAISERGSVYALMGRGLIFGGDIKAHESIHAKRIGNISGCINSVTLGYDPELDELEAEKKKELEDISETAEKLRKSTTSMQASGLSHHSDKHEVYLKLMEQRTLYDELKRNKTKELKELRKRVYAEKLGSISCEKIYPITQIHIGEYSAEIQQAEENCKIHIYGGRILLR